MASRQFYKIKSLVSIEEDEFHEFKGHRSIGIEDLPPWCFFPNSTRRTRKPASRTMNAFLNSGRGGTLYLGIIDEGMVKGFYLTESQKDHIRVAIKDLFTRYTPQVDEDKYDIYFVPILEKNEDLETVLDQIDKEIRDHDVEEKLKPHLLRTYDFCWCDKDLARRIDEDERPRNYVVEVKIQTQKTCFKYFEDGSFKADIPITYQNEEGICFFRTSASCKEYNAKECHEHALQQLRDMYEPIMDALRQEVENVHIENKSTIDSISDEDENDVVFQQSMSKSIENKKLCPEIKDCLELWGLKGQLLEKEKEKETEVENEVVNSLCRDYGIVFGA